MGAVAEGGETDDAGGEGGGGGLEEEGFEELEEEEVGEVVGTELGLEAVGGVGEGGGSHYAGVIDEKVECTGLRFQVGSCCADLVG